MRETFERTDSDDQTVNDQFDALSRIPTAKCPGNLDARLTKTLAVKEFAERKAACPIMACNSVQLRLKER